MNPLVRAIPKQGSHESVLDESRSSMFRQSVRTLPIRTCSTIQGGKSCFYGFEGGGGQRWSGLMILVISATKFQTPMRSVLELTSTTIVVRWEGR